MKAIIKYEDDAILVIHKPAGIATETARIGQADVVSELKNYLKSKGKGTYLGTIHRLDQPVEGLLVFAKTPEAAKALTKQLENGTLKKSYAALVPSMESEDATQGELEDYLLKDGRTNLSKVVSAGTQGAKKAKLSWKLLHYIETSEMTYSLVEVEIFTGRHHQIRVQMSHAGMPLLGDNKYGNEVSRELTEKLGIRHTALLANRLQIMHPVTKQCMQFEIPYPADWKC
ncbi:MAG: RluA family pseudouridine synthase [Lachnospiraceae bacterium]|nr:RluA family pseudouridine synthase [Lachnospiraceae bacterium]